MSQIALFDESIEAAKPPRPAPTRRERIAWVREQRNQAHARLLAARKEGVNTRLATLDADLEHWENELRRLDPMEDLGGIGPRQEAPLPLEGKGLGEEVASKPDHAATTLAQNEASRRLAAHRAIPDYDREEDWRILTDLARHQKVLYEITGGYRA